MIETIRAISGPDFLFFYCVYALLLFVVFKVLIALTDDSRNYVPPPLNTEGPFEIAVLKNGSNSKAVLHTVLFSLWEKKILITESDGSVWAPASAAARQDLTAIERDTLHLFSTPQKPAAVINNPKNLKEFDLRLKPLRKHLVLQKLLLNETQIARRQKYFFLLLTIFLLPGLLKLFFGLSRYKPVAFLVIQLTVGMGILILMYKRHSFRTALGTASLKKLIQHNRSIMAEAKNTRQLPAGADPLLLAALFGAGALMIFPEFMVYGDTFHPSKADLRDSLTGGCSGCSGAESSGGGGDGGGDGGGSGCGGCGGGD
jgi:uncharacterized protein (TIGR04222 family)